MSNGTEPAYKIGAIHARKGVELLRVADCQNPLNHAGCHHAGWRQAPMNFQALNAARDAANYASRDLGLDLISIKFFEPGPIFSWDFGAPDVDKSLVVL